MKNCIYLLIFSLEYVYNTTQTINFCVYIWTSKWGKIAISSVDHCSWPRLAIRGRVLSLMSRQCVTRPTDICLTSSRLRMCWVKWMTGCVLGDVTEYLIPPTMLCSVSNAEHLHLHHFFSVVPWPYLILAPAGIYSTVSIEAYWVLCTSPNQTLSVKFSKPQSGGPLLMGGPN